MDTKAFFTAVRATPMFAPKLVQSEVDGINTVLAASASTPLSFIAYMLATAWWETAHTMQPIDENGGDAYFFRRYDIKGACPDIARQLGNLEPGDGARFHGRGFVQVTGRGNYTRIGKLLGVDLADNPDAAKEPVTAARILHDGLTFGWFSGRRLGQYLPPAGPATAAQFGLARWTVNGQDHAPDIAHAAGQFQAALSQSGW